MAKMYIGDGLSIVAEQNPDQNYSFELYLDVEKNGMFWKQIAVVRSIYRYPNEPVPDTFEVLQVTSDGDDLEAVEYFNGNVYTNAITLRKSPETGMIPSANGNPQLADLSFRIVNTDNWIGVRFCPEEMEVYVGIIHGLKWWQNLFRLRVKKHDWGGMSVRPEIFSEYERSYTSPTNRMIDLED